MLNSQQLQQLKIEGLLGQPQNQRQELVLFSNLNTIFQFSEQIKCMGNDENANIRCYMYLLLHNIYQPESNTLKPAKSEELIQSQYQLMRLKKLLLHDNLDMTKIINIPQQIHHLLKSVPTQSSEELQSHNKNIQFSQSKNKYLKKLILEFLEIVREQLHHERKNSSFLTKLFTQYPLIQIILSMFVRGILFKQYDIDQALNFNYPISDHTLYTVLCDAFGFNGLRLQENQSYIGKNYIISSVPLLNNPENRVYFLGLRLKTSGESNVSSVQLENHTFRMRKQSKEESKRQEDSIRFEMEKLLMITPQFTESYGFGQFERLHKQKFRDQREYKDEILKKKKQSEEFTSLQILQYLSPQIRQSMLSNPKFKNFNQN